MTNMQLSRNFSLSELTSSSKAKQYKIDNSPNFEEKLNLLHLCQDVLQPIRDAWKQPISINSGFRCAKLNRLVGGAANSDHLFGAAADIRTTKNTKAENKKLFDLILKLAKEGKVKCRQIIDEYGYKWIHVSVNHSKNKYKNNEIVHIK